METVKTYDEVHRGDDSINIRIVSLADAYRANDGKPDTPHRHNFYTVLLIGKSVGEHHIDFNAYPFGERQVFFIAPGQVHQIVDKAPPEGFAILFSRSFLAKNNIPEEFIRDLNLFHDFGYAPPIDLTAKSMGKVCAYANDMLDLQSEPLTFSDQALGALLKLILIQCHNACSLPEDAFLQSPDGKNSLLREFKLLIEEHYKDWHAVHSYAEALSITTDHLNRVVKAQTGKTSKEHIQSKIIVEAKRLLFFTSLSLKEVSYELGFSEPANFSAFFKKNTGMSPSDFRSS